MKTRRIYVSKEDVDDVVRKAVSTYESYLRDKEKNNTIMMDTPIPDFDIDKIIGYYDDTELVKSRASELDEGLIKSYDAQNVKNIILKKFRLSPPQVLLNVRDVDGQKVTLLSVILTTLTYQSYIDDLVKFMDTCGYHQCVKERHQNGFVILVFEPHFTQDISAEIKQKYKYLYHATPSIYVNKILSKGLIPMGANSHGKNNALFLYPDRVYCMRGDNLTADQIGILRNIQTARSMKQISDNNEYTILKISVGQLPDNIVFYADPMVKSGAIFTHDNIPPQAISVDTILSETQTKYICQRVIEHLRAQHPICESQGRRVLRFKESELKQTVLECINEVVERKNIHP